MIRDLKMRIAELESANKRLKECPPDGGVAAIQEELIRVKMREAEASLSLKVLILNQYKNAIFSLHFLTSNFQLNKSINNLFV